MKFVAALLFGLSSSTLAFAGMDMSEMDMPGMAQQSPESTYEGIGIVKKTDKSKGIVTLSHEPIESLKWPAMTMDFEVRDKALFGKLIPGKKVRFEFVKKGNRYLVIGVK